MRGVINFPVIRYCMVYVVRCDLEYTILSEAEVLIRDAVYGGLVVLPALETQKVLKRSS